MAWLKAASQEEGLPFPSITVTSQPSLRRGLLHIDPVLVRRIDVLVAGEIDNLLAGLRLRRACGTEPLALQAHIFLDGGFRAVGDFISPTN